MYQQSFQNFVYFSTTLALMSLFQVTFKKKLLEILIHFLIVSIIFEEPVVSKKPTFSTESTSISFQKHQGQNFALLCQAQAFPIPLIRFVYSPVDFYLCSRNSDKQNY